MRVLTTIILTFILLSTKAQSPDATKGTKREFENQGEQEDYWATQLFDKEYHKQSFTRFAGNITLLGSTIKYGDQTLEISNTLPELIKVFTSGILYPQLINGDSKRGLKSKEEVEKLSADQRLSYYIRNPAADSLKITDFEEMKFLNKTVRKKRFRFWLFHKWLANPTTYYIELTNENATDKTSLELFISGSKLTFFKQGNLVL